MQNSSERLLAKMHNKVFCDYYFKENARYMVLLFVYSENVFSCGLHIWHLELQNIRVR
jgi:hypothetical protein